MRLSEEVMEYSNNLKVFTGLSGILLAILSLGYGVSSWKSSRVANELTRTANAQASLTNRIVLVVVCQASNEACAFLSRRRINIVDMKKYYRNAPA